MANKWLVHVKKTMRQMKAKKTYVKGKGLKQVIDEAKLTWHKVKKGGADSDLEDVPLKDSPVAAPAPAAEKIGDVPVLGGRKRKTHRRGRHSRRR